MSPINFDMNSIIYYIIKNKSYITEKYGSNSNLTITIKKEDFYD